MYSLPSSGVSFRFLSLLFLLSSISAIAENSLVLFRDENKYDRIVRNADGSLQHLFIYSVNGQSYQKYLPAKLENGTYTADVEKWPQGFQNWWKANENELKSGMQARYDSYTSAFKPTETSQDLYGRYDLGRDGRKNYNLYYKNDGLFIPVSFDAQGNFVANPAWGDKSHDAKINEQGRGVYNAVYKEGNGNGDNDRWKALSSRLNNEFKDVAEQVIASSKAPPPTNSPSDASEENKETASHGESDKRNTGRPVDNKKNDPAEDLHKYYLDLLAKSHDAGLTEMKTTLPDRITRYSAKCVGTDKKGKKQIENTDFYFENPTEKDAKPRLSLGKVKSDALLENLFAYPDTADGPSALDTKEGKTKVDASKVKGEFRLNEGEPMFTGFVELETYELNNAVCSLKKEKAPKISAERLDAKKDLKALEAKLDTESEGDLDKFKEKFPDDYKRMLADLRTLFKLDPKKEITLDKSRLLWEGNPPGEDSRLIGELNPADLSIVSHAINQTENSGALRFGDIRRDRAEAKAAETIRGTKFSDLTSDAKRELLTHLNQAAEGSGKTITSIAAGRGDHKGEIALKTGPITVGWARPNVRNNELEFEWKNPINTTDGKRLPPLAEEMGFKLQNTFDEGTLLSVPSLGVPHFTTRVNGGLAGKFTGFKAERLDNGNVVVTAETSNNEKATFTINPETQKIVYSSHVDGRESDKTIESAFVSPLTRKLVRRQGAGEPVQANYDPGNGNLRLSQGTGNSEKTQVIPLTLPEGVTARAMGDLIVLSDKKGAKFGPKGETSREVVIDANTILENKNRIEYRTGSGWETSDSVQKIVDSLVPDLRIADIENAKKQGKTPESRDGYRILKSIDGKADLFVKEINGKTEYVPGSVWGSSAKVVTTAQNDVLEVRENNSVHFILLKDKGFRILASYQTK